MIAFLAALCCHESLSRIRSSAIKIRLSLAQPKTPNLAGQNEEVEIFSGGRPRIELHNIGRERQPVMVVDGLLSDPERAIRFAADRLTFAPGPVGSYFPGERSRGSDAYVDLFRRALDAPMRKAFALPGNCRMSFSNMFSLTTTGPEELGRANQMPHVDSVERRKLGVVHFLFDRPLGGTSFYRHHATGWETLDEEREPRYLSIATREMTEKGYGRGYRIERSGLYDLIYEAVPAMDRLVIFPGNLLHGAGVPDDADLVRDPFLGRLTINSFIQLQ